VLHGPANLDARRRLPEQPRAAARRSRGIHPPALRPARRADLPSRGRHRFCGPLRPGRHLRPHLLPPQSPMRKLLSTAAGAALLFAAAPAALHAQWKTETYALKGGWNAIWLHGDATHATPAELFAAYPDVLEIWRWNPNPDQIQLTDSTSSPDATSAEWTIWNREDPEEQTLSALLGQSAYLIRCNGASTTTINVSIPQRPRPPSASVVPAPSTTSTTDHAEVFRRAFWRQPTSTDRILQAERRVNPEDDSWQWFIQLHPSPEL